LVGKRGDLPGELTASLEDYLEAIFHIIEEKQAVRVKDIARRLKVRNPSVTGALRSLAEKELILYAPYDVISLTEKGKAAARDVVRRHEVLRDFFVKVFAVEESAADEAACRMEHSVPKEILERFIRFAEFVEVCPRGGSRWIGGFESWCSPGGTRQNCERCLQETLEEVRRRQGDGEAMPAARLNELKMGQRGKVLKVHTAGEAGDRIAGMGVAPGAVVEIERVAPLGGPIDIKVKGYHHSLRKDEAEEVEIEAL
jgi:DtxR family Mn-dependent transcriptional regulator